MKINEYLTYDTVRSLGEERYIAFRQALKQQGHGIAPMSGDYNWHEQYSNLDSFDPSNTCLFLTRRGDLCWGKITKDDLPEQEVTLAQALAMINEPTDNLDIAAMTIGQVKAKIAELEQQLEATNQLHRQQYEELTKWRTAVRQMLNVSSQ